MRLSHDALSTEIDEEIARLFVQVASDVRSPEDMDVLLRDLLAETERLAIAKRLAIALFLTEGKSYDQIKKLLKVSSATVAKVQEMLDTPGMKLALRKIHDDQWASQWAKKLSGAVEKLVGKTERVV